MKNPYLTRWVSAAVTPQDKELLQIIAHIYGSTGESATVRRLIRDEARRRGLVVDMAPVSQPVPGVG